MPPAFGSAENANESRDEEMPPAPSSNETPKPSNLGTAAKVSLSPDGRRKTPPSVQDDDSRSAPGQEARFSASQEQRRNSEDGSVRGGVATSSSAAPTPTFADVVQSLSTKELKQILVHRKVDMKLLLERVDFEEVVLSTKFSIGEFRFILDGRCVDHRMFVERAEFVKAILLKDESMSMGVSSRDDANRDTSPTQEPQLKSDKMDVDLSQPPLSSRPSGDVSSQEQQMQPEPDTASSLKKAAIAQAKGGNYAEAVNLFQRALNLCPNGDNLRASILYGMAVCCKHIDGPDSLTDGLTFIKEAIEILPKIKYTLRLAEFHNRLMPCNEDNYTFAHEACMQILDSDDADAAMKEKAVEVLTTAGEILIGNCCTRFVALSPKHNP